MDLRVIPKCINSSRSLKKFSCFIPRRMFLSLFRGQHYKIHPLQRILVPDQRQGSSGTIKSECPLFRFQLDWSWKPILIGKSISSKLTSGLPPATSRLCPLKLYYSFVRFPWSIFGFNIAQEIRIWVRQNFSKVFFFPSSTYQKSWVIPVKYLPSEDWMFNKNQDFSKLSRTINDLRKRNSPNYSSFSSMWKRSFTIVSYL